MVMHFYIVETISAKELETSKKKANLHILHQEGGRGRSCCLVDILRSRRKDLGKEYEEDVQML
jgi:hypothetical protein